MTAHYIARHGDVLDTICLRFYGRADVLQQVLDANPGLAARGALVPAGTAIVLPDIPPPRSTGKVRLWD